MMFLYADMCCETSFLFGSTRILMFLALLAYLRVLIVSSYWLLLEEMVAIMTVLQLPPSESFNILVSLESRKGTKKPFFDLSPSALIQLARANKLVLILAPSLNRIPWF